MHAPSAHDAGLCFVQPTTAMTSNPKMTRRMPELSLDAALHLNEQDAPDKPDKPDKPDRPDAGYRDATDRLG